MGINTMTKKRMVLTDNKWFVQKGTQDAMGGTRDIYSSSQTFLASFECEPITVYAWVDLKKELERSQASDKQTWESL